MNPQVNWFFEKQSKWRESYAALREIILESGLTEELKWGCPCYTHDSKNVVLMHGFKEYCALLFMKGAILNDPDNLFIQQSENVQAARQIRFKSCNEVIAKKAAIKSYLENAADLEKRGIKVELKKTTEYAVPEEFKVALEELPDLKTAFGKLTPGRQRGYLLHFSSAKQARTRSERVVKYIPKILSGKGLED